MPTAQVCMQNKTDRNRGKYGSVALTSEDFARISKKAEKEQCTRAHLSERLITQFISEI